jgi:hypothetical protein
MGAHDGIVPNTIVMSNFCSEKSFLLTKKKNTSEYYALFTDGFKEQVEPITGTPRPKPDSAQRTKYYKAPSQVLEQSITPSRFSGSMRKAVACYHATGKNAPFSYTWKKTHGLVKKGSAYWVVEVSKDGVYAVPVAVDKNGKCCGSYGVLKCIPTFKQITDNPELAQYKSEMSLHWAFTGRPNSGVTQLIDDTVMAEPYLHEPFYTGHGWAFSYSGHEAQSVTVSEDPIFCSRWKLVFSGFEARGVGTLSAQLIEVREYNSVRLPLCSSRRKLAFFYFRQRLCLAR